MKTRLSTVRTVVPTSTAQETSSAASVSTTESNVTGHSTLVVTVIEYIILTNDSAIVLPRHVIVIHFRIDGTFYTVTRLSS